MNAWETFRYSVINPNKWWRYLRASNVKQLDNYYVVLPAFTVNNVDLASSSFIVTEFLFNNQTPFTIPRKLTPPANPNFCLAIRSPSRNSDGLHVQRYKLWSDIGEVLSFPSYEGQRLNPDAALEIWTLPDVNVNGTVINLYPYVIYLSYLRTPSSNEYCCYSTGSLEMQLTQRCSLFAEKNIDAAYDISIVFDICLNDVQPPSPTDDIGIITEDGSGKISTESGDAIITENQI